MTLLEMLWRFTIIKVESPFSGRKKSDSSFSSSSRSVGDGAEVKAVVLCASPQGSGQPNPAKKILSLL